eukprot:759128-Hanusia_phi.AAC.1
MDPNNIARAIVPRPLNNFMDRLPTEERLAAEGLQVKEDIEMYFNRVWNGHNENQALIENGESKEADQVTYPKLKALEWEKASPPLQDSAKRSQRKDTRSHASVSPSSVGVQPAESDVGFALVQRLYERWSAGNSEQSITLAKITSLR